MVRPQSLVTSHQKEKKELTKTERSLREQARGQRNETKLTLELSFFPSVDAFLPLPSSNQNQKLRLTKA